jgi:hypothetical protein
LPGVKPQQTAQQYVERCKDTQNGKQVILAQIQIAMDRNDTATAEKLRNAAVKAGVILYPPSEDEAAPSTSDDDIRNAVAETDEQEKR